ncbi:DNA-processing protein DprA [Parahaliea aestuarii]|uniref:DNA-processing protein DprA n=1 Tax=Parahaliea aestuarii TaxID=1852021 RepID=A0A5C8ZN18_9GAMM|nr:DNA-processing protein DprA [Parahaliea aestuarii]TXS88957.1 DNA-processing protein DprA [Parahaliea aestuarii]
MQLAITPRDTTPISPLQEMGAYEALWDEQGATFKRIADKFREHPGSTPTDFVDPARAAQYRESALNIIREKNVGPFGIRVHGAAEYPGGLRDARHPVELLYYQGWWDLIESPCVAVVGSREASPEGLRRAKKVAALLARADYTVVSGLAAGIDTAAHESALAENGRTIAVIGTPLSHSYPAANKALQQMIRDQFLLVSQVPFVRYSKQGPHVNRLFFPERNKVMSALTQATIIVEAGETSGTLVQAKAAIEQGRKLLIMDSCFRNPNITWPERFASEGAHRISDFDQILDLLR